MALFVIGDIQGCFDELKKLLNIANFKPQTDTLWCLGDVVNRGPKSLETLEFLYELPNCHITLGNHDFLLLAAYYTGIKPRERDTIDPILQSRKASTLCHWLRHQSLMHYNREFKLILSHAGVYPLWDLQQALHYSLEIENILQQGDYVSMLKNVYTEKPQIWQEKLTGMDRYRFIIYSFTVMRFVAQKDNSLDLSYSGKIYNAPSGIVPWFYQKNESLNNNNVLFGHWSALEGVTNSKQYLCLDTGCAWGKKLTMLRADDFKYFSIDQKII